MSKQRRIKKLVKQRLNAKTALGPGAPDAFPTKANKKEEERRLNEDISDAALLAILLDPDADTLAADVQTQKEAEKAGILDAVIETGDGRTEEELGTDAIVADTDDDGGRDDA